MNTLEHAKKYRVSPIDWFLEENPEGRLISLDDPIVIEVIRKAAALDKMQKLAEDDDGLLIYVNNERGVTALYVHSYPTKGTICQKDNLLLAVEGYIHAESQ